MKNKLDEKYTINGCFCIGFKAGELLTDEKGVVIIGDNIKSVPKGARVVIGKYVSGERCNLFDILSDRSPEFVRGDLIVF